MKAPDILKAGIKHMEDRAKTYDKPEGERSMAATVAAFNAMTGHSLTTEQGWLFQICLKCVRSQQGDYRADNYEDGAAYFGLMGEAAGETPDIHDGTPDTCGGMPIADVPVFFTRRQDPPSITEPVDLAELMTEEREIREEWDERRMDIIGQNGNDGLHYDALPGGLSWDRAPDWATDLGRVGLEKVLVWYNAERYEYVVSGQSFHFGDDTRSLCSVINIARRPVIDMKKQPIKRNVCLSCGGGHALHKCQGGADE